MRATCGYVTSPIIASIYQEHSSQNSSKIHPSSKSAFSPVRMFCARSFSALHTPLVAQSLLLSRIARLSIPATSRRPYSPVNSSKANTPQSEKEGKTPSSPPSKTPEELQQPKSLAQRRSMSEQDMDLQEKMRQAMGDADMANVEMEDGIPDGGMRRNVKANMFRVI